MLFEPDHQRAQTPGGAIKQAERLRALIDIGDTGDQRVMLMVNASALIVMYSASLTRTKMIFCA